MKPLHKILFSIVLGAGLLNAQKADLIVTNGKITTMDDKNPEVQAVAIKDNKIFQTGTNAQMLTSLGRCKNVEKSFGNVERTGSENAKRTMGKSYWWLERISV